MTSSLSGVPGAMTVSRGRNELLLFGYAIFSLAFIAAARLAGHLMRAGINCYSPIVHTHPIPIRGGVDPLDHSIWMPFDESMMHAADNLLVAHLPTWETSYGISLEVEIFKKAGKPIFDVDPDTLVITKRRQPP
jgi:hypothetical protein